MPQPMTPGEALEFVFKWAALAQNTNDEEFIEAAVVLRAAIKEPKVVCLNTTDIERLKAIRALPSHLWVNLALDTLIAALQAHMCGTGTRPRWCSTCEGCTEACRKA